MIDLSKVKARELPKKTVEVNILGTKQEHEITVLSGESRIRTWSLDYTQNPDESTLKRVKICLGGGAGLSEDEIVQLISLDWDAAVQLCGEIMLFTREFESKLATEKAGAEKNSAADVSTGMAG